jgi:hypothetical protein
MPNSDDATSTELAEELRDTMTGIALPWRAYPERFCSGPAGSASQPGRETYGLCDGNGVTIARGMQRAVAEAVAAIVNQRVRLRGGEQVRAPR